jgi:hypothetical protein
VGESFPNGYLISASPASCAWIARELGCTGERACSSTGARSSERREAAADGSTYLESERGACSAVAVNISECHAAPTPNSINCPNTMATMIVTVMVCSSFVSRRWLKGQRAKSRPSARLPLSKETGLQSSRVAQSRFPWSQDQKSQHAFHGAERLVWVRPKTCCPIAVIPLACRYYEHFWCKTEQSLPDVAETMGAWSTFGPIEGKDLLESSGRGCGVSLNKTTFWLSLIYLLTPRKNKFNCCVINVSVYYDKSWKGHTYANS